MQAELYRTLGGIYQKLGNLGQADSLLSAALAERKSIFGPEHPEVAESLVALGLLRVDQARLDEAERLFARDWIRPAALVLATMPPSPRPPQRWGR